MAMAWFLILSLLCAPLVLGHDLIEICNQCKDGKLINPSDGPILGVDSGSGGKAAPSGAPPGPKGGAPSGAPPGPKGGAPSDPKGGAPAGATPGPKGGAPAGAPPGPKGGAPAGAPPTPKGGAPAGAPPTPKGGAPAGAPPTPKGGAPAGAPPTPKGGAPAGAPPKGGAPAGAPTGPKDAGPKDAGPKKAKEPAADGISTPIFDPPLYGQKIIETDYKGEWIIHNPNCGVNAMQLQLMPNNKAIWFDTTNLGPSARELGPKGNCPPNPDNNNEPDCFAHGLQYDVETGEIVTVYVRTDPWCSSGHLLPNGDLLSTGGNKLGNSAVRLLSLTDPAPKFVDRENALGAPRWYPSNAILEDGTAVVVGGRDSYSYDIVPPQLDFKAKVIDLPFLQQTTEPAVGQGNYVENNLYPFLFLLPDGNLFLFANDRAIKFDPKTGAVLTEYPVLEGGSRNYPPSGQAALLPLRLSPDDKPVLAEVVVCGGNKKDAFPNVDPRYTQNRVFTPALADCNRIKPLAEKPVWEKEQDMPSPRTMGDLLQLPNGQLLLISGAKKGTSGWDDGEDPNFTPTLYMPENEMGKRFKELTPTTIARMYHSSSCVLPDGKILVAGSNAHQFYTFDGPYPTELRVEKFSPPYLDPKLEKDRPVIKEDGTDKVLKYGKEFKVTFTVQSNNNLGYGDVLVTLLYPPFTTHGFSQNQRLLIVGVTKVDKNVVTAMAPASGKLAPPGYYLMFVNHLNVPSKGMWVHLD